MSIKVLYVGDTQVNVQTSIKGIDSWTFAYYSDSARYLRNALRAADDIILDHIPSMNCIADMPSTVEEMKQYLAFSSTDATLSYLQCYLSGTVPGRLLLQTNS